MASAGHWARARSISGWVDMDNRVNEILDRLPAKPPRSRLDRRRYAGIMRRLHEIRRIGSA
jgi:hypothetical protein